MLAMLESYPYQQFGLVNFDGCGPITGWKFLQYIGDLSRYATGGGVFAITILAGRDRLAVLDEYGGRVSGTNRVEPGALGIVSGRHKQRLNAIMAGMQTAGIHPNRRCHALVELYRSRHAPMLQCAWKVTG